MALQRPGVLAAAPSPAQPPKHPAPFPEHVLEWLRLVVPPGPVLDPMGGIGRLGMLGSQWQVTILELEMEWALQAQNNGCVEGVVGDATAMPWPDESWDTVVTSPSYGNRCSDTYAPEVHKRSDDTRRTYRIYLNRALSPNNGGAMHFKKDGAYEKLHTRMLAEVYRVLRPGGSFILNIKEFIRDGEIVGLVGWWHDACIGAGFLVNGGASVFSRGDQNTSAARAAGKLVIDHETIMMYRKPRAAVGPTRLTRPRRTPPAP